jgi:hypothetical protein
VAEIHRLKPVPLKPKAVQVNFGRG